MTKNSLIQNAGYARESAFKVLKQVVLKKGEIQASLDQIIKEQKTENTLTPQDVALCTELCYGSLRKYIFINTLLISFLAKPNKLPDVFKIRLTIAVYELLFLQGTPDYASLYLNVQGIKIAHGQKLANVANAVLRELQRLGDKVLNIDFFKSKQNDILSVYSNFYSIPLWIVKLWHKAYGETQSLLLLEASSKKAPNGLRINLNYKDTADLLAQIKNSDSPFMTVHKAGIGFQQIPAELRESIGRLSAQGALSRQSVASQEILWAFEDVWESCKQQVGKNNILWDACAGRGGKCIALAEQGVPISLATDLSYSRLKGLNIELKRLGLSIANARLSVPHATFKQKFYTILLDAPCSGLGTLSRHPDISLHRQPEDLTRLIQTQAKMLNHCAELLQNNGHLVYMTCTLNPAENEEQIEKFLQENPEFKLIKKWHTPYDSPFNEFFWGTHLQKQL